MANSMTNKIFIFAMCSSFYAGAMDSPRGCDDKALNYVQLQEQQNQNNQYESNPSRLQDIPSAPQPENIESVNPEYMLSQKVQQAARQQAAHVPSYVWLALASSMDWCQSELMSLGKYIIHHSARNGCDMGVRYVQRNFMPSIFKTNPLLRFGCSLARVIAVDKIMQESYPKVFKPEPCGTILGSFIKNHASWYAMESLMYKRPPASIDIFFRVVVWVKAQSAKSNFKI